MSLSMAIQSHIVLAWQGDALGVVVVISSAIQQSIMVNSYGKAQGGASCHGGIVPLSRALSKALHASFDDRMAVRGAIQLGSTPLRISSNKDNAIFGGLHH